MNNNVSHNIRAEIISQVATYFDVVDNCVREGDTNKKYTYAQQSTYAGPTVTAKGNASFIISPSCDNTADIKNGFIITTFYGKATIDKTVTENKSEYTDPLPECTWIGWDDAYLINEKYDLVHEGQSKYTQSNAIEEGYITNCSIDEKTKKKDFYSKAPHKTVWKNYNGSRCGMIVDWSLVTDKTAPLIIPLKIDLRRYLPLSNCRYLPAFIGKLELKCLFTTSAMIVYPIDPRASFYNNYKRLSELEFPDVTCEPVQIGDPLTMITECTVDATTHKITKMTTSEVTIDVANYYEWKNTQIIIPNFAIVDNVYNMLKTRYTNNVFTIPTSTMLITDMNSKLNGQSNTAAYSITPRFFSALFLLFPLKPHHRTIYKNPGFTNFEIKVGGYGSIPDTSISFNNEPRLLEYVQQALNLNEDGESFSSEVLQSLTNSLEYDSSGKIIHDPCEPAIGSESLDCTHFLCGFKLQPSECFQQGQTTNSPIDYNVNIKQDPNSYYSKNVDAKPRICFMIDSTLSFQLREDGGPPVCVLDASDITTPAN